MREREREKCRYFLGKKEKKVGKVRRVRAGRDISTFFLLKVFFLLFIYFLLVLRQNSPNYHHHHHQKNYYYYNFFPLFFFWGGRALLLQLIREGAIKLIHLSSPCSPSGVILLVFIS